MTFRVCGSDPFSSYYCYSDSFQWFAILVNHIARYGYLEGNKCLQ